jgi:hypothetical protein
MAQRKNKERKQKLLKYKNSKKMSETKAPEMKPFQQIPTWSSTEKFEINGAELEALYQFFNIFGGAFNAVQQVFARGIQSGKVQMNYQYEDGTPVSDEEVKAYTESVNAYFKEQLAKRQSVDTDELKPESGTGKVLNLHGVEATEDNV